MRNLRGYRSSNSKIIVTKLSILISYQTDVTKLSLLFSYQIVGYQIVSYQIVSYQIVTFD